MTVGWGVKLNLKEARIAHQEARENSDGEKLLLHLPLWSRHSYFTLICEVRKEIGERRERC